MRLPKLECPDQERLCPRVRTLRLVERREVVEAGRDVWMHRPQRLLQDGERTDIERLGPCVRALRPVELRQVVEGEGDVGCTQRWDRKRD